MINNINTRLSKEVCELCSKSIQIGHPTVICSNCDKIFHGKCAKSNNFTKNCDKVYCNACVLQQDLLRYNPFLDLLNGDDESDKFYNTDSPDLSDSLENISKILEDCRSYSKVDFSQVVKSIQEANKTNNNNSNDLLSTFFLNIDGNFSNFDQLVTEIHSLDHRFSVIGLAETNIDAEHGDLYKISDEYTSIYQSKLANKKKGTGIGLYINNKFTFEILEDFSMCTADIECMFVSITNTSEPHTIGVMYRSPNGSLQSFNSHLTDILTRLPDSNVCIMGDFNINLHNITHSNCQEYEEIVVSSGYCPLISTTTHSQPNCAKTCIDNILTNSPDSVIKSGTISEKLAHHSPIFHISVINMSQSDSSNSKPKITIYYEYSRENVENFCCILKEKLENENELGTFEKFTGIYQESIDEACKLNVPKTTKRNRISNPWITAGLINAIDKKHRLLNSWKKSVTNKNKHGDESKYEKFKSYRKFLKSLIYSAKNNYYLNKFEANRGNKKKTWEIINQLRGKTKSTLTSSICIDNNRITSRRIIANKFNNYFASIAKTMNDNAYSELPIESFPSFHTYLKAPCESSIFLEDCTADEITTIISEFENGKASDIPITLVKQSKSIISPTLSKLFNNCMMLGHFPEMLKTGKITPIFKKGNKELIENYRPVSTLPIFGKILEKIIYSRLYSFFTSKGILTDSQFGFRKGHSTTHAIHHSVDIIKQAHKLKKHVIGVFIDLSKAFDTLEHNILLHKLNNSGIRGNANQLIGSYLAGRKQYTNYSGHHSDTLTVLFGVPQGSVLGPLLFLLYINDIVNCFNGDGCKFVLYADDTNIFIIDESRESASAKANVILQSVHSFMKSNLLHINLSKCCYMYFKPPSRKHFGTCARTRPYKRIPKITINGHTIKEVDQTKFLGITIDNKLTWLPHVETLHKKLKSATGTLRRIRHSIPKENYKSLYYSLFESHMNYGITIFGGIGKTHLEKLFRVQKHCVRLLFGDLDKYLDKFKTCARTRPYGKQILGAEFFCREHTKPLFNKIGILAFQNIYNYQVCLETLKILKSRSPTALYNNFQYSRRNNGIYLITSSSTIDFTYNGSRKWNMITKILAKYDPIHSIKVSSFKRSVKLYLQKIQNMYNDLEWCEKNFELETALRR